MKSIAELKQELQEAGPAKRQKLLEELKQDPRAGARALVSKYEKKEQNLQKERARLASMRAYEEQYEHLGYVCGIDEVGRGPLAGPVMAAAVILPKDCEILYLNDSKKLSAGRREALYDEIMAKALAVGVGEVSHSRIDEINILQATYEAMRQAVDALEITPQVLLIDAVTIPNVKIPQVPIVKGDAKSVSIAAASVIAKVTRDRLMIRCHEQYPVYGFDKNKGYGSREHIEALRQYGPCKIHRRTFISHLMKQP